MHTWGKSDGPGGIRLSFILSITGFVIPIAAILLILRPPEQIVPLKAMSASGAQSFQAKLNQLQQMHTQNGQPDEVHLTADEISSAFAQSAGSATESAPGIAFRDDVVTGQFVSNVAGQHVYITVSGHLGAKEGYVTFDPTEFKVGDLNIPVALANPALQKKILEQREQLKLPAFVGDLRIENGELVIRPK